LERLGKTKTLVKYRCSTPKTKKTYKKGST